MFIITGWQCDYFNGNARCENYSKIQPHKDFNNNRVYCENHWKIVNKINQERRNKMTRNEFNNKYKEYDIHMDRDFELLINNNYIKPSEINILKNAINDYEKLINEIPQVVKDWLLG